MLSEATKTSTDGGSWVCGQLPGALSVGKKKKQRWRENSRGQLFIYHKSEISIHFRRSKPSQTVKFSAEALTICGASPK